MAFSRSLPPADDRAEIAHGLYQRRILAFGIADEDIVVGVEDQESNQLLDREGLAGAGHAQHEGRLVQQVFFVAEDQVMGNGALSEVDAAGIPNLLHFEGNEDGQTFGRQGAEGVDFPAADGQHRVETVQLLILQHRHLTHMLAGCGEDGLGVCVQLLLGIGSNNHGNYRKHHALVTGGQVVQKLFGFLALQLHIIGHHSGEIVVAVLAALPVGDVGLHAQQTVLHLPDGFIGGDGNHVDGKHHVAVEICQLGYHAVLDVAGVVLEIQDSGVALAQFQVVGMLFDAVRTNVIPKAVAFTHIVLQVKGEGIFLTGAIEVVEDTQALQCRQLCTAGAQRREVLHKICPNSCKIGTGFLNVLLGHGDGDILLLQDPVGIHGLVQQHFVVFLPVLVQPVGLQRHEDGVFKVRTLQVMVVHRDLGGGSAVQ